MNIGERLRTVREHKSLSQGDIEKRTGLLRCYLSRVENGHTVPAIETLEKLARALDMPLYQLLYDGDEPPKKDVPASWTDSKATGWGSSGKDLRFMRKLRHLLGKMQVPERELLMFTAQQMARKRSQKPQHAVAKQAEIKQTEVKQTEVQPAAQQAPAKPEETAAAAAGSS